MRIESDKFVPWWKPRCDSTRAWTEILVGKLSGDSALDRMPAESCVDSDWDACSVVATGEVRFSSKTAKQRFADILPNCVSKPKSMTPSGMMSAISLRYRITSRITPQGESVPKFQ
jgi:hypothetical protein